MPAESAPLPIRIPPPSAYPWKCSICGAGVVSDSSLRGEDHEGDDGICGGCVRASSPIRDTRVRIAQVIEEEDDPLATGLGLQGVSLDDADAGSPPSSPTSSRGRQIPLTRPRPPVIHSQSLPTRTPSPWSFSPTSILTPSLETPRVIPQSPSPPPQIRKDNAKLPNPVLDISTERKPSIGRGALYPGSIFRGTQTSGRSAYEVEVRLLDVNFPESTLSGYLSISHLTDAHPHLTTFFTGEIVGPKHGFITGSRFGATEHDDMRHWGRFEQFRRPATRADMVRPDLLFRDAMPDRNKGETKGKERDFVFLRIKERFLVPDHTVKDITGASFAGFYYAMVDLAPSGLPDDLPPTPTSPSAPKSPLASTSPTLSRRMSASGGDPRSPTRVEMPRRRRESSSRSIAPAREPIREATIRGYYFHPLNQEPFQELFITHVPNKSSATMEMR